MNDPTAQRSTPSTRVLSSGVVVAEKYELVRLIGRGGMGEVWSARHRSLDQEVAIKFLVPVSGCDEASLLSRFQLEARIAAHLSRRTRHVASVFDCGVADGTAYLVMELVDGVPLEAVSLRGEHRDLEFVSGIVDQVAKGLSVAHALKVVHRDVKPANIMLVSGDEPGVPLVKILDFGIGKLERKLGFRGRSPALNRHWTVVGEPLGTPEYMSPEQVRGLSTVDGRCDVWALGVVTFELLTGVCPFEGTSPTDTLLRVLARTCDSIRSLRPDLPAEAEAVFARAFARPIDARFPTVLAFAEAIRALAKARSPRVLGGATQLPPRPAPALRSVRRRDDELATVKRLRLDLTA